eukprot:g48575.t1
MHLVSKDALSVRSETAPFDASKDADKDCAAFLESENFFYERVGPWSANIVNATAFWRMRLLCTKPKKVQLAMRLMGSTPQDALWLWYDGQFRLAQLDALTDQSRRHELTVRLRVLEPRDGPAVPRSAASSQALSPADTALLLDALAPPPPSAASSGLRNVIASAVQRAGPRYALCFLQVRPNYDGVPVSAPAAVEWSEYFAQIFEVAELARPGEQPEGRGALCLPAHARQQPFHRFFRQYLDPHLRQARRDWPVALSVLVGSYCFGGGGVHGGSSSRIGRAAPVRPHGRRRRRARLADPVRLDGRAQAPLLLPAPPPAFFRQTLLHCQGLPWPRGLDHALFARGYHQPWAGVSLGRPDSLACLRTARPWLAPEVACEVQGALRQALRSPRGLALPGVQRVVLGAEPLGSPPPRPGVAVATLPPEPTTLRPASVCAAATTEEGRARWTCGVVTHGPVRARLRPRRLHRRGTLGPGPEPPTAPYTLGPTSDGNPWLIVSCASQGRIWLANTVQVRKPDETKDFLAVITWPLPISGKTNQALFRNRTFQNSLR